MTYDGKDSGRVELNRPNTTGGKYISPARIGVIAKGRTPAERIKSAKKMYPDGYNFKAK